MENFRSNGGRKGVAFVGQTPPVSGASPLTGAAPSASMETVLERLQRLEARFADEDGRGGDSRGVSYQRPDPDPPYGMPPLWKSPAWVLGGHMATGPESRPVTTTPATQTANMHRFPDVRASGGNQQQLGFRSNPSAGPHPFSTWELGPIRTEWDHPAHRMGPQSHRSDPSRLRCSTEPRPIIGLLGFSITSTISWSPRNTTYTTS